MAAPSTHPQVELRDDAVRAGVTGHNVRYVLAAGLTGVIVAFAGVAVYFGYETLQERLHRAFAQSPSAILQETAPYAALLLCGLLATGLLLSLWTLIAGRDEDASQLGMRLRVVAQFVVVCLIMAMVYFR